MPQTRKPKEHLEMGCLQVSLCHHWEKSGLLEINSPPAYLYQISNITIWNYNTKTVFTHLKISLTML